MRESVVGTGRPVYALPVYDGTKELHTKEWILRSGSAVVHEQQAYVPQLGVIVVRSGVQLGSPSKVK